MEIETKNGKLRFKQPMSLDDFGEALQLFERLIKLVSGDDNKTVQLSEFTDWLKTTDYVEVEK